MLSGPHGLGRQRGAGGGHDGRSALRAFDRASNRVARMPIRNDGRERRSEGEERKLRRDREPESIADVGRRAFPGRAPMERMAKGVCCEVGEDDPWRDVLIVVARFVAQDQRRRFRAREKRKAASAPFSLIEPSSDARRLDGSHREVDFELREIVGPRDERQRPFQKGLVKALVACVGVEGVPGVLLPRSDDEGRVPEMKGEISGRVAREIASLQIALLDKALVRVGVIAPEPVVEVTERREVLTTHEIVGQRGAEPSRVGVRSARDREGSFGAAEEPIGRGPLRLAIGEHPVEERRRHVVVRRVRRIGVPDEDLGEPLSHGARRLPRRAAFDQHPGDEERASWLFEVAALVEVQLPRPHWAATLREPASPRKGLRFLCQKRGSARVDSAVEPASQPAVPHRREAEVVPGSLQCEGLAPTSRDDRTCGPPWSARPFWSAMSDTLPSSVFGIDETDRALSAVKAAWDRSNADARRDIVQRARTHDKPGFQKWWDAARLKDSRGNLSVAVIAALGKALWPNRGSRARSILSRYFVDWNPEINRVFLAKAAEAGATIENADEEVVQGILHEARSSLTSEFAALFELFEATLRLEEPGWFKPRDPSVLFGPVPDSPEPSKERISPTSDDTRPSSEDEESPSTLPPRRDALRSVEPATTADPCETEMVAMARTDLALLDRLHSDLESAVAAALDRPTAQVVERGRALLLTTQNVYEASLGRIAAFSSCPPDCPGAGAGCSALQAMASLATPTTGELQGAQAHLDALGEAMTDLDHESRLETAAAKEIAGSLGDSTPRTFESSHSLREAIQRHRSAVTESERLDRLRAERIDGERREIAAMLTALEARATSEERIKALDEKRASISVVLTLGELTELKSAVGALERVWAQRPIEAVVQSLCSSMAVEDAIELIQRLQVDRPAVALAFAWLFQVQNGQHLLEREVSLFFGVWLDALLTIERDRRNDLIHRALPALIEDSVLPHLRTSAIPREPQLAIRLFLMALSHAAPSIKPIAHQIDAFKGFGPELPAISSISDCISQSRDWRIVDSPSGQVVADMHQRVESMLGELFIQTLKKARKPGPFRRRIEEGVGQILRNAWIEVCAAPPADRTVVSRYFDANAVGIDKSVDDFCDDDENGQLLRRQFGNEIDRVKGALQEYVDARCDASSAPAEMLRSQLEADVSRLADDHPRYRALFVLAHRLFTGKPGELVADGGVPAMDALFLRHPDVVQLASHLAKKVSTTSSQWQASEDDLLAFVHAVVKPPEDIQLIEALSEAECHESIVALAQAGRVDAEVGEKARQKCEENRARMGARAEELAPFLEEGVTPQHLRDALKRGRVAFVSRELNQAHRRREDADRRNNHDAEIALKELRAGFQAILADVDDSNLEDDWKERIRKVLFGTQDLIGQSLSKKLLAPEKHAAVERLRPGMALLKDFVQHGSHDWELLDAFTERLGDRATPPEIAPDADLNLSNVSTRVDARRALWSAYLGFRKSPDPDAMTKGRSLVHDFSKLVALYCDDTEKERVQLRIRPKSDWLYMETAFHKPGSNYFDRPVRVHLLPGGKRAPEEMEILRASLDRSRDIPVHTVALTGSDSSAIRKALTREIGQGRITLVDRDLLRQILEARTPGAPLRQALRRTISVEHTSPFKTEGHVSKEREIYVGRREVGQKILDGRGWMIWGGRRSGKTSLLHATASAFRNLKGPHHAVYESLESVGEVPFEDLDLHVARQLGRSLGWDRAPTSLEEFKHLLENQCKSERVCLLIDEFDAYLEPHFRANSHTYGVVRHLRSLQNKLGDRLICIFAGFRHLYRVARLVKRPDDPSYPFQNWLAFTTPLSRLRIDETTDLVREGFEEILGMEIEPTVPQKIFKYTGGHPASVQYFCHCVLRQIAASTRTDGARRITEADVEATYRETQGRPGEEPFIRFVETTLDMNLQDLERIIIYVIAAVLIGRSWEMGQEFRRRDVIREVSSWFDGALPSEDEYTRALGYLEMTGMLETNGDRVKMAFPSYAEILLRLEEANKDRISSLVASYKPERAS